jgi:hypothetical protein
MMGSPGFNVLTASCFITRIYLLLANFSEQILQLTIKKQSEFKWNLEVILNEWKSYSGAVPLAPHASPRSPIKVWDPDVMVCLYFSPLCKSHQTNQFRKLFQPLDQIGNRLLRSATAMNRANCQFKFQGLCWDVEVIGGQSEDSLL